MYYVIQLIYTVSVYGRSLILSRIENSYRVTHGLDRSKEFDLILHAARDGQNVVHTEICIKAWPVHRLNICLSASTVHSRAMPVDTCICHATCMILQNSRSQTIVYRVQ